MGKLSGVFSLDGSYNQTNVRFRSMKGSEWIFLYPGVILIICAGFLILSCGIKCLALCLDSCCCRGEFADEVGANSLLSFQAMWLFAFSHPVKRTWFCITWHGLWHCQYRLVSKSHWGLVLREHFTARLLWWQSSFSHLVVSSLDNLISNFTMFCAHQDNAEEGTFQVWLRQGDETQSEVEIVIQGIPASVVWAMLSFDLALLLNFFYSMIYVVSKDEIEDARDEKV